MPFRIVVLSIPVLMLCLKDSLKRDDTIYPELFDGQSGQLEQVALVLTMQK